MTATSFTPDTQAYTEYASEAGLTRGPPAENRAIYYAIVLAVTAIIYAVSLYFIVPMIVMRVTWQHWWALAAMIPSVAILMLYMLMRIVVSITAFVVILRNTRAPAAEVSAHEIIPVTVQIATYNEPFDVLKQKALKAALELQYPESFQIQVLDDSTDPNSSKPLEVFCQENKIEYIHRADRSGFKAGALNNALPAVRGKVILVLDGDSCVPADTLIKGVLYFRNDPALGYAQCATTCGNIDENIITRIRGLTDKLDWEIMLPFRNLAGLVPFKGHNGFVLTEAVKKIGGWAEYCRCEDLATALRIRMAGYRGTYIPDIKTTEDAPKSFNASATQLNRWAMGSTQILLHDFKSIWASAQLRWYEKIDVVFFTLSYITLIPAIAISFIISVPLSSAFLWVVFLPVVFLVLKEIKDAARGVRQLSIGKTVIAIALLPFVFVGFIPRILAGAIFGLTGRESVFSRTPDKGLIEKTNFMKIIDNNKAGLLMGAVYLAFLTISVPLEEMYCHILGIYLAVFFIAIPLVSGINRNPPAAEMKTSATLDSGRIGPAALMAVFGDYC